MRRIGFPLGKQSGLPSGWLRRGIHMFMELNVMVNSDSFSMICKEGGHLAYPSGRNGLLPTNFVKDRLCRWHVFSDRGQVHIVRPEKP